MCKVQSYMACQHSTSGRWVGSGGRLEAVGATLRGELEAEVEVEVEGEMEGVPLTITPSPEKH